MNRFVAAMLALIPVALGATAGCSSDPGAAPDLADDPGALVAPAAGTGFQFKTPLAQVEPGEELQACYFYKVSDLEKAAGMPVGPLNLHRVQIAQRKGSHHMNIFRVRTILGLDPAHGPYLDTTPEGECFRSSNWSDWPLVANTQQEGELDWTYPDGVANVLQPDEWLMLQSHYVNATTQKTPKGGEVVVNFHSITNDEVKAELGTLFATKQSIRICKSNPHPKFQGTCQFKSKEPVHIIGANGHFHSRGKTFDMYQWDGESIATPPESARFYDSQTWDEPPMLRSPQLDLTVQPGAGVFYTCEYDWQPPSDEIGGCATLDQIDSQKNKNMSPDCCYTFGPIVERNEHCNAFVYYYPKQDDVFCN